MSALRWADVAPRPPATVLVTGSRRGKTNPEGEARDVRFVKGDITGAVRTLLAAATPGSEDRVVPLSPQMVGLRFQAGLASELTSRGASTTDVMLAGNWKRAEWWRTTRPGRRPSAGRWRSTSETRVAARRPPGGPPPASIGFDLRR